MVSYATVQDVSNELNGLTIDGNTTPSETVVESWIEQESDLLKKETNRLWSSELVTEEYLDYDGSGFIRTDYSPIISITSLEYESGTTSEEWTALTEGRYNNYITYKDEGEIKLLSGVGISEGFQNIRITYNAGYSVTNDTVVMIIAKKVALRVMSTILNEQGSSQGGSISIGSISISDPTTFSVQNITRLNNEIKVLTDSLGSFKVYRYNR